MLEGLPRAGLRPDRAAGRRLLHLRRRLSDLTDDSRALCDPHPARGGRGGDPGARLRPAAAGAGTLRFSYAGSTADIAEGLRRLEALGGGSGRPAAARGAAGRALGRSRCAGSQEPPIARDHQPRRLGRLPLGLARPAALRAGSALGRPLRRPGSARSGSAARSATAVASPSGSAGTAAVRRLDDGADDLGEHGGHRLAHPLAACGAAARRPRAPRRSPDAASSPRSITSPSPARPPARAGCRLGAARAASPRPAAGASSLRAGSGADFGFGLGASAASAPDATSASAGLGVGLDAASSASRPRTRGAVRWPLPPRRRRRRLRLPAGLLGRRPRPRSTASSAALLLLLDLRSG